MAAEAIWSSQGGALAHNCSNKLELSLKDEAELHTGSSNWKLSIRTVVNLC